MPLRPLTTALVTGLLLVACATSPLGRRQLMLVSQSEVTEMGIASYRDMQKKTPATKDPKLSGYVNCVARKVTAEIPGNQQWEVTVFDSKDINAFALPGGKIGVYTGLLAITETPDQLAAVIGHEVAHVIAGHSNERVSQQQVTSVGLTMAQVLVGGGVGGDTLMSALGAGAQYGVLLPFSRAHESEADLLGLDYMAKAGFDPRQAAALWRNMAKSGGQKPPEFASSHPSDETRIRQIEGRLPQDVPVYVQALANGRRPDCKRV